MSAKRHRAADARPRACASRPSPSRARRGPRRSRRRARARTRRCRARRAPADAEQLVLGGERAGHRLAVDRRVQRSCARSRSRARRPRCLRARARPSPRCRRRWPARCARRARPSRSARTAPCGTCVPTSMRAAACVSSASRYSGKVSQPHVMPSVSAVPGMSSTPSMSSMSQSCLARAHRREADAAVAHDHRGDAVPARRREQRVPGDLAVVVGVDVDEARRDQQAVGVDVRRAAASSSSPGVADLGDAAVVDGDVGGPGVGTGAVDQRAAADHELVHGVPLG